LNIYINFFGSDRPFCYGILVGPTFANFKATCTRVVCATILAYTFPIPKLSQPAVCKAI